MQTINQIDLAIDANRRVLMARIHCNPCCSAQAWQNAWNRHPDLQAREQELYRQRGIAQAIRDSEITATWKVEQRRNRAVVLRSNKIQSLAEAGRKACLASLGA